MQVVEHQHHRTTPGGAIERGPHAFEKPKARGLGDLARRLQRLRDPQLWQQPRQLLPGKRRDCGGAHPVDVLPQSLHERLVGRQRLRLAAAGQHRDTRQRGDPAELEHQPRLTGARIAADQGQPSPLAYTTREQLELVLAPHERAATGERIVRRRQPRLGDRCHLRLLLPVPADGFG